MSERWQEYWDKYQELGTYNQVALHFEVQPSTVRRVIVRASERGQINLTPYENPPGYKTGKVTIQANADGTIEKEWRRISPEAADIEDWVNDLCDRAGKAGPKIKTPKVKGDTALEIPIGDMHMGMYAWDKETGANWDTDRACRIFKGGVSHLIDLAPKTTKHLILTDLGDFLHSDNRFGLTEKSGNVLDMDTRWTRVIDMARDAWIEVIEYAAARFPSVYVTMIPGNHNTHAAHWMARVVDAYFRNCKHVTIDTSPTMHRYHQWGNTLIGNAHGHLLKANQLASIMATEAKQLWAKTTHHHWRNCHVHHGTRDVYKDRDESDGVTVEYFPILPPRDAYHAEKGYMSRRLLQGILHHEEHGEITRHTVHARMLG
ncbi:MAG: hypothetical protein EBY40_00255 [Marivivens sp.]|nr:hypothetical protein [Marivivens sp.]NBT50012.1 hypothetical protein [Marivivens sp.]NCW67040.1 hypothetical protein [Marivivens sp.]NDH01541.1 hypothetical protein [Marivivens sp.]